MLSDKQVIILNIPFCLLVLSFICMSTGEGMRKNYAVGKKKSITGEWRRRDFGKKKDIVVMRQSSLNGGPLAEWDHQEAHQVQWDHGHLWKELVTWRR